MKTKDLYLNNIEKQKQGEIIAKVLIYLLLITLVILCIVPFYLMIVNATRSNAEINRGPTFIPGSNLVENWKTLTLGRLDPESGLRAGGLNIMRGFWNSFYVAVTATVLAGYFSALTAYGFTMYNFRGKKILFAVLLSVIMLPPVITLIGIFKLMVGLGLYNSHWALILPAIASPYTVFFLRGYIGSAFNKSLLEAARMDGATELGIFHRIAMPLIFPGIATMSIFGFLAQWNNYLMPLILLNKQTKYTLPLVIQQLNTTTYNRDLGALYTGVAVSVVPIIIAFAIFSRYLIDGISFGAVKE